MIDTSKIETVYLIGIGGIGMSALARYFRAGGKEVHGYDRTGSSLTDALSDEGCRITLSDDPAQLTENLKNPGSTLVIYTPAIPFDNKILAFFRGNGHRLYKRSEVLGEISGHTNTLAVAGTHGKTTISTLLAHLLMQTPEGCSAFLGGISKNYMTNMLLNDSRYTVIEADEFDRSFLRLEPAVAVVTSVDADHLDIYGDYKSMLGAYNEFIGKIRPGGKLVVNNRIKEKLITPESVSLYTYGFEKESDFCVSNIRQQEDSYLFDLRSHENVLTDLRFSFPGRINIENAAAASSVALLCGVSEDELRKGLLTFRGVRRRFDIIINRPGLVYIDDYAHHPDEIKACINSVREYFGTRRITGIFQPHLYSRTRDHAAGFAEILDKLDEVILLPVYPAREIPIAGITSSIILERMRLKNKRLLVMDEVITALEKEKLDVLLTIGAGDIDKLVKPIANMLNRNNEE